MSRPLQLNLQLERPGFSLLVDLTLPGDGITVLFGASGSGKTSLLRCVAGLERAQGRVSVAGQVWQDDATGQFLPTWQRPLGYVFQEASLFEHLSVRDNLAYGQRRSSGAAGRQVLEDAVALLGIGALLDRSTTELSGGERQRVAMARALATQPQLLLLDEPLASLDAARREDILPWLLRLGSQRRLPMLYVTHSVDELVRLGDHVVVLEQGRVRAQGPAQSLLADVQAPAVVGEEAGVLLLGQVQAVDARWQLAQVGFEGGVLWLRDTGLQVGQALRLRVLARDVSLALEPPRASSIQNLLPCRIDAIADDLHPAQALVRVACGPAMLLARLTRRAVHELQLAPGQAIWAQVKSVAVAA